MSVNFRIVVFVVFLFSAINLAFAQTKMRTISGYVKEAGSQETLPGVNVVVVGQNKGAVTNNYGFFSITFPLEYKTIAFSYVGYKKVLLNVDSVKANIVNVELVMDNRLAEIVVSATQATRVSNSTKTDFISIPTAQVKEIPALLGEKDVFKTLQLLPGVKKGQEGSSGIYVRGGGPDQNLVILDDATVYNVNHLFGFFSIFNGDAIKSIELTKGGFPARYGGRLSSVVEMNMKDGNKEKFSGEAGIGLISSRFTFEGPLKKNVSSFLISARRTYIDVLTRPMVTATSKPIMYFYDLNAKVNYDFGNKNKLYLSGYFGRDKFGSIEDDAHSKWTSGIYWQNATATLRWNHLFSNKLFSNASFIFSSYGLHIFDEQSNMYEQNWKKYSLFYRSGIRDLSFKYDLDYHPSTEYLIKVGAMSTHHQFTPSALVLEDDAAPLTNHNDVTKYNSLESSVYMENRVTVKEKFQFNAGFRITHFLADGKNYLNFEPRFSANYQFMDNTSVKASYAMMNQYVHLLSNTGIGLPTDLWVPSTARISPQQSSQISLGLAHDMPQKNLTLTVEGYYKKMKHVIGYKPGASFLLIDDPESAKSFDWQDNVIAGQAKAYGVEMMLQRKSGRLRGWIGYTLSWVKQQFDAKYSINNGDWFWARYDRRHDISVVGIYELAKHIRLSGTWVYASGSAFTMPVGAFNHRENSLINGISGANYGYAYSSYYSSNKSTDYGPYNGSRMSPYHRLDVSISFIKKRKTYERTWEFGLYNAYSNKNPFFYMIESDNNGKDQLKQYSLFPMIPSVSYNIKF